MLPLQLKFVWQGIDEKMCRGVEIDDGVVGCQVWRPNNGADVIGKIKLVVFKTS